MNREQVAGRGRKMSVTQTIYLDYNATTPVDPRVVEAILPYFNQRYGNASSRHHEYGWEAKEAVEKARQQVSGLIGALPQQLIWTSGATESNNLAIKGVAAKQQHKGRHIITAMHEHEAVLNPCNRLEKQGYEVTRLKPARDGVVRANQVAEAISDQTILISIMWANNEIGTINQIPQIARICRQRGVIFHSDATQMLGKMPVNVREIGVDLLSASAHKFYGPKGVGFLYVRDLGDDASRVPFAPQVEGGGHEHDLRAGTLNVPGIVGLGVTAEICQREQAGDASRLVGMRQKLEAGISEQIEGVTLNGHATERLPNTANIRFAGVETEALMVAVPGLAISFGAACTGTIKGSHVLAALGNDENQLSSSIRFSLGRFTRNEDVDKAIEQVAAAVRRLRNSATGLKTPS